MKESKYKANNKYLQANYEHINLSVPKGTKSKWKQSAELYNMSLCEFVRTAVRHYCSSVRPALSEPSGSAAPPDFDIYE